MPEWRPTESKRRWDAMRAQQKKYDEALGRVPYVALVRIDQKLTRLLREAQDYDDCPEHYAQKQAHIEAMRDRIV